MKKFEFRLEFHGSLFVIVPNKRRVIIWTSDGLVYWRIYASLGLNELNKATLKNKYWVVYQNPAIDIREIPMS